MAREQTHNFAMRKKNLDFVVRVRQIVNSPRLIFVERKIVTNNSNKE